MLKKVAKALDEMAKNEELMGGILAAAEEDLARDGEEDDELDENGEKLVRLNTIGEDGEADSRHDTNKDLSRAGDSKGGA